MRRNIDRVEVLDIMGRRLGTIDRDKAIDLVVCHFARAIRGKQIKLTGRVLLDSNGLPSPLLRDLSANPGTARGRHVDKWKDLHPGRRKAPAEQPAASGFFNAQERER